MLPKQIVFSPGGVSHPPDPIFEHNFIKGKFILEFKGSVKQLKRIYSFFLNALKTAVRGGLLFLKIAGKG
jgi:hypothetical protein